MLGDNNTLSHGVASFGFVLDADNSSAYNVYFDGDFRGPANGGGILDPGLTEFSEGQVLLLVAAYTRAASGTTTTSFWLNPTASSFGLGSALTALVADSSNGQSAIDTILIHGGSGITAQFGFDLDEFSVGTTWADVTPVPKPSTLGFLALGVAGLILRRRRLAALQG